MPSASRWLVGTAMALVFGLVMFSGAGFSQEKPNLLNEEGTKAKPMYFGTKACLPCHEQTKPDPTTLCDCTEYNTWSAKDKHKLSFELLKGERAQRMGKTLEIPDVLKARECLSCHAIDVKPGVPIHEESFKLSDGVTCAVCHGMYVDWVDDHGSTLKRKAWRAQSREEKWRDKGMRDLWDPVKRTDLCVSCHVGNASENKVVTHAMYAAGHPPLPGFEVATFSEAMPRHWKYPYEKSPQIQKEQGLTGQDLRFEKTQLVLVSGLAAFRQSQALLAFQAGGSTKDNPWPELAQFDCYACHHDLKQDSWRQKRKLSLTPGRPDMRAWPLELVYLGAKESGVSREQVAVQLKALQGAFSARPFGDSAAIKQTASGNVAWSSGLLTKLAKETLDEAKAERLLIELVTLPPDTLPDYDSARQITWAALIILGDLQTAGKLTDDRGKQIQASLDAAGKELKIKLPATQQESIEGQLKDNLEKIANYDPNTFVGHMRKLSQLLGSATR